MKNINYISYLCLFFFYIAALFTTEAQTYYTIPDDSLRKVLIRDYPLLMTADGKLDVAAAKATSQDIILDYAGITNADGIQFFESTGILKIRNNKLTSLPQLSYMKNLRRIYINGNMITSIPNLSALYQLIDLFIGNNKITSISGLETITTLQYFNFAGNKVTTVPDLSALVNLKTLSVGFNPLTTLPDLSPNINLQQLDVSNCAISSVPSLANLINLETFICDHSNFTDLSGLNTNTKLIKLTANNCNITTLPNLSNKPNITSLNISNNKLTFEDLIPLTSLATFSVFTYTPQKDLSIPLFVDIREPNSYSYQLAIDASLSTNQYTWFKNGVPMLTNATGNYTFSPVFMGDSGSYKAEVRNPALPLLVLKSNASKLTVRPCVEINTINISVLSSDCREGSLIDLAGTTIDGAVAPINYTVQSTNPVTNINGTTATQFSNVIPGTYVLCVTDSRNCTALKSFQLDKGADCESVFSPNGDGIMDSYFIPDTGTIQIYNSSKKLIRTMNVPAAWDGTSNDGSLADAGYYVIIINGSSSIDVSLMR
jgi:internalin A